MLLGELLTKPELVIKYILLGYGSYRVISDMWAILYKWKKKGEDSTEGERLRMLERRKPARLWNTAIFFPDHQFGNPGSPTAQLIALIEDARISIQICVYLTSYVPLEEAILKKYSQGLIIQVVTCHDTLTAHNNHFKRWRDLRIPVRSKCTRYLMHNKFVIIDDEAVITGSLNWTTQGIVGNQENVIISTDERHVAPYRRKFAELWNAYAED